MIYIKDYHLEANYADRFAASAGVKT